MLTPAIFNDLSKRDQVDLIHQEGMYLSSRELPEFTIDLYALDGFYVEVFYHKFQDDLVVVKGTFDFNRQLYSSALIGNQLKVA